jgi:hypothetical protein
MPPPRSVKTRVFDSSRMALTCIQHDTNANGNQQQIRSSKARAFSGRKSLCPACFFGRQMGTRNPETETCLGRRRTVISLVIAFPLRPKAKCPRSLMQGRNLPHGLCQTQSEEARHQEEKIAFFVRPGLLPGRSWDVRFRPPAVCQSGRGPCSVPLRRGAPLSPATAARRATPHGPPPRPRKSALWRGQRRRRRSRARRGPA